MGHLFFFGNGIVRVWKDNFRIGKDVLSREILGIGGEP